MKFLKQYIHNWRVRLKNKYAIEEQLFILYENRIRLCIINEIIKKPDSIWYNVIVDSQDDNNPDGILLQCQEMGLHKSVDDLLKSLVDDFKMSMNFMDAEML